MRVAVAFYECASRLSGKLAHDRPSVVDSDGQSILECVFIISHDIH